MDCHARAGPAKAGCHSDTYLIRGVDSSLRLKKNT
jgi:hypothetical protein